MMKGQEGSLSTCWERALHFIFFGGCDPRVKLDAAELIVARSHPKARVLFPCSAWLVS